MGEFSKKVSTFIQYLPRGITSDTADPQMQEGAVSGSTKLLEIFFWKLVPVLVNVHVFSLEMYICVRFLLPFSRFGQNPTLRHVFSNIVLLEQEGTEWETGMPAFRQNTCLQYHAVHMAVKCSTSYKVNIKPFNIINHFKCLGVPSEVSW